MEKVKKFVRAHKTLVYGIVMFTAGAMIANRIHISNSGGWSGFDAGESMGWIGVRKSEYLGKAVDIGIGDKGNDAASTLISLKNKDAIDFAKMIKKTVKE